jgi:hypothetical protein
MTTRSKEAAKTDATRSRKPRRIPMHVTLNIAQNIRRSPRTIDSGQGWLIPMTERRQTATFDAFTEVELRQHEGEPVRPS